MMRPRLVTQPEEFSALRPKWDALVARLPHRSIFLRHAWFDAAWHWKQREATLFLVCCEREDTLVGVLPLVRLQNGRGPAAPRTFEFLTVPDTQRCDALIADDDPFVAAALASDLVRRRGEWDVLRLRYLPEEASALGVLLTAMRTEGLRCEVARQATNPWIALDGSWDEYYGTRSRRLKKAVNLAANRLAKLGTVEVDWLGPATGTGADVDNAVAAIIGISARSWKTRTGNSLDNPGPQSFLRQLALRAHGLGALSIWTLKLNDVAVAMELQLVDEGAVYALRSDFDASLGEASPGSHLSRVMLERLFGRNLVRYYMGPGENAYKFRWTEDAAAVQTLTVYAPTVRGKALATWELAVKPTLRRWIDRFRSAQGTAEAD